ncbi:MAG: hypothetical protein A2140_03895 [Candidatus Muproteobacteria bacterium RBG_16_62_13]|uniref:PilZ domain-containing protein n=1 Tax=Candidatus Muproteobacteria bacterium RBG_16_62_13 TaxID=1817756 RepID=A0A1F6T0Y5_9PROT|nr:MAG: hypothetical protein A2140_03895 [Candidatus Muproteobacteria bacterium RBG_16_62_13]
MSDSSTGERRSSHRHLLAQEAMVSQGPHFRLCNLRDISLDGAFFDLGWGVLTRQTPVEVTLSLPGPAKGRVYRLSGEVARVSKEGTAVKFHPIDDKTRQDLSGLLRSN